jgi:hypothetical protein
MATTNNLNQVLATVSKDFASLKVSMSKLLQTKKIEGRNQYFERNRERRTAYGLKYDKVTLDRKASLKDSLSDQAKTVKSSLSTFGGLFGNLMLIMGVAGIGKMLLSSETGKYFSQFLKSIFESVVEIIKQTGSLLLEIFQDSEVKESLLQTFKSIFKFIGQFFITSIDVATNLLKDSEVLQSLGKIVMGVFSAIAEALKASYEVLVEIASTNIETIKTSVVGLFTKIVDVIVPLLGIIATVLSKDSIFVTKIIEIAKGVLDLIWAALNQEYENPNTGEKVNVWGELAVMLGKGLLLAATFAALKLKILKWAVEISASKAMGGSSNCDCGLVTPDVEKSGNKPEKPGGKTNPRGTPTGPGNKASQRGPTGPGSRNISSQKELTKMEKFKVLIEKYWKKLLDLGTRARYGSKAVDVIVSFLTRKFRQVASWKITTYVVSLLTSVVATAAGAAGAAATGGISALVAAVVDGIIFVVNLYLGIELAYDIIKYLCENADEIIKEIDKETQGTQIQNVAEIQYDANGVAIGAVPMASTAPTSAKQTAAKAPAAAPAAAPVRSYGPGSSPVAMQPEGPAQSAVTQAGKYYSSGSIDMFDKTLLDFIARGESGGDYNSMNQGGTKSSGIIGAGTSANIIGKKLTEMTVSEVMQRAAKPNDSAEDRKKKGLIFAAGRYQIIPGTLQGLVKAGVVGPGDKFDETTQDKLGRALLEGAGLSSFKSGKITAQEFQNNISKTWGAVGNASTGGTSLGGANKSNQWVTSRVAGLLSDPVSAFQGKETQKVASADPNNLAPKTEEQKKSLTDVMFDELNEQLAALDKMTGGKLGLSSGEMQANIRELEDKMRAQPSMFDFSTTAIMNTTKKEVSKGTSSLKDTNESVLSAMMSRHYA